MHRPLELCIPNPLRLLRPGSLVNRRDEARVSISGHRPAAVPAGAACGKSDGVARTFGPAADPITQLGWGLGIISLLVILIIAVLLLGAIFRKRAAVENPDQLAARSDTGGMSWIYIGVGTSSLVLAGCMVWTLVTINAVTRPLRLPMLTVQVTASQWWWGLRYMAADPAAFSPPPTKSIFRLASRCALNY